MTDLLEQPLQLLGDGACHRIVAAAGGGGHDDGDGLVGIRHRGRRGHGQDGREGRCNQLLHRFVSFDGFREHVRGDVEFALQDLSGGPHECGALDAGLGAIAFDDDLDVDAALRMQHRDAANAGSAGVAAGHGAGQRERGGDADGAGDRVRRMTAPRREVARGDAVGVVAVAGDHRLGHHAAGHVAEPHEPAGSEPHRLDAREELAIGIELRPASRGRSSRDRVRA